MPVPRLLLEGLARRLLRAQPRTAKRLLHPVTGKPLQALLLVDVDLDGVGVRQRRGAIPGAGPGAQDGAALQGVHAVGWLDGTPLGEATYVGEISRLLPTVPEQLATALADDVRRHRRVQSLLGATSRRLAAPSVSVVVCTRDRPDNLRRALPSLVALNGPVLEVIVVDNASRGHDTRDVAAGYPGVRYIHEARPGLDWARNRGLHEATGDVVAYTDDDVEVHPDWVLGIVRALHEEPAAVGVTGLVLPLELSTPAQILFEIYGGFARGYLRRWYACNVAAGRVAARDFAVTAVAGTGANMAFRRRELLALGGFDPALDVGTPTGGGGDLEMFYRVVAAGHLLVYEPSAVVFHRHRRTMAQLRRQLYGNGIGSYAYWLGAGSRYDRPQRRAFRAVALRRALAWNLKNYLRSLVMPDLVPRRLIRAEARGMVASVISRAYARSSAAAESYRDGDAPVVPLVRPTTVPAVAQLPEPVVEMDLDAYDAALPPDCAVPPSLAERLRLTLRSGGVLAATLVIATNGRGASRARLAHEVARHLDAVTVQPAAAPLRDLGRTG